MKKLCLSILATALLGSLPVLTTAQTASSGATQQTDVQRVIAEMAAAGVPEVGKDLQKLNALGYQALYETHDTQKALKYFGWNAVLFPQSADLQDSLAEGYLQAGQREKAIELYEKALKMNPRIQTNAATILAKLKSGPDSLSAAQQEAREAYQQAMKNGPPKR